MFRIGAMALLLAGCSTTWPNCSLSRGGPVEGEFSAAALCVLDAADRLERSGEAADVVARAAVNACTTDIQTYERAALASGCLPPDLIRQTFPGFRSGLQDMALTQVIERRSDG